MKIKHSFAPMSIEIETEEDLAFMQSIVRSAIEDIRAHSSWHRGQSGVELDLSKKLSQFAKQLKGEVC